jgi:hypothetical protein
MLQCSVGDLTLGAELEIETPQNPASPAGARWLREGVTMQQIP